MDRGLLDLGESEDPVLGSHDAHVAPPESRHDREGELASERDGLRALDRVVRGSRERSEVEAERDRLERRSLVAGPERAPHLAEDLLPLRDAKVGLVALADLGTLGVEPAVEQ